MKESRVELYERIRKDRRDEEASIRELSRRYRVHRRMGKQALASAVPAERKSPERESPALGPWMATIRGWLEADVAERVPRKQRHTARRVWQRLVEEHEADVSESAVRGFVAEVKAELADAALDVTISQEHPPARDGEVDFGEFGARIGGHLAVLQLFVMRLSCSCRGVAYAFAHQAQEAFIEGHVLLPCGVLGEEMLPPERRPDPEQSGAEAQGDVPRGSESEAVGAPRPSRGATGPSG